jgi:hypothetical protein
MEEPDLLFSPAMSRTPSPRPAEARQQNPSFVVELPESAARGEEALPAASLEEEEEVEEERGGSRSPASQQSLEWEPEPGAAAALPSLQQELTADSRPDSSPKSSDDSKGSIV